jgi:hypothetical protein
MVLNDRIERPITKELATIMKKNKKRKGKKKKKKKKKKADD